MKTEEWWQLPNIPNSDYFDFSNPTHKIKNFDETFNFLTNNEDYKNIIKYLLDTYTMNIPYKQIFYNKNGIQIESHFCY